MTSRNAKCQRDMESHVGITASSVCNEIPQWSPELEDGVGQGRRLGSNVMGVACQRTLKSTKVQEADPWKSQRVQGRSGDG